MKRDNTVVEILLAIIANHDHWAEMQKSMYVEIVVPNTGKE